MNPLAEQFGDIDIYLFDQLLRGRIRKGMRILDAGCGGGRNLVYLRREGFDVWGVDRDPEAIASLGEDKRFRVADIETMPFVNASFGVVLCSAVLHFARDRAHFDALFRELNRVLAPGGMLFCRLASSIGMADLKPGRCRLPDGTERYLVDEEILMEKTAQMNGRLLDPLKTTVVQGLRCMTTWVVEKRS